MSPVRPFHRGDQAAVRALTEAEFGERFGFIGRAAISPQLVAQRPPRDPAYKPGAVSFDHEKCRVLDRS
jgi:hypothetical protein